MGGVLLVLVPQSTMMLAAAGLMAADGRCKTFDAAADGYVRAEACKMLYIAGTDPAGPTGEAVGLVNSNDSPDAARDPDAHVPVEQRPVALLLRCGVNTNGRASALTAPHGPSQLSLQRGVLRDAGMSAAAVAGVQLHANGTALGDPIEVGAAVAAYQGQVQISHAMRFFYCYLKCLLRCKVGLQLPTCCICSAHTKEQKYAKVCKEHNADTRDLANANVARVGLHIGQG